MKSNFLLNAFRQQAGFFISFLRFIKFMYYFKKNSRADILKKNHREVAVLITPWMYTAVPWFAIAIGLALSRKICVKFIYDASNYDNFSLKQRYSSSVQNFLIEAALLLSNIKYEKISKLEVPCNKNISADEINELRLLAHKSRIHRYKTSLSDSACKAFEEAWFDRQLIRYSAIKNILKGLTAKKLLIPGGVYGNSGLYCLALKDSKKISSYDSGLNRLLFCLNGIAGYQQDVGSVVRSIDNNLLESDYQAMYEYVMDELSLRARGLDFYRTQICSNESKSLLTKFDVVIPLNITWDLPALGKHNLFVDNIQWLDETIDFLLNKTKFSVCVRQHPHERHHTSGDDLAKYLVDKFGGNQRFLFISATEEVNSYNLIAGAKVVLPYVSTIGIEAALMGKCVIMESSCYYSSENFVIRASDKQEYFELIKIGCESESVAISKERARNAVLYYYVGQYCTPLDTIFTPFAENFKSWSKWKDFPIEDEVIFMINSLINDVPAALLKSNKFISHINFIEVSK
jgi:hypothetical protein